MPESFEPRSFASDSDASRLIAEAVARGDLNPDPSPETLDAVASILRAHYAEQASLGIRHCATCHQPFPTDRTNSLHGYQFCSKACRHEYLQWAKRSIPEESPTSTGI